MTRQPTATTRTAGQLLDPRTIVALLPKLTTSPHPAVVFSSLAAMCVPAFSDHCEVLIAEAGQLRYRIVRPLSTSDRHESTFAQLARMFAEGRRQIVKEHSILTLVRGLSSGDELDYHGIVMHTWRDSLHPEPAHAAIAQRMVDRATVVVHQQRLVECLGAPRPVTAVLQRAAATVSDQEIVAAIAILMGARRVTYTQAFYQLRTASRQSDRTFGELATELVRAGSADGSSVTACFPQ